MSRIGKKPIQLKDNIKVGLDGQKLTVTGPKGSLDLAIPHGVEVKIADDKIMVESAQSNLHGLIRSLIANMVTGVELGWQRVLELNGTGYRANLAGRDLNLALGFSHPVLVKAPDQITFTILENKITVSGIDKALVGETAAKIRKLRPADPYKAKGFKYDDEVVRRKAGKAAKAGGAK